MNLDIAHTQMIIWMTKFIHVATISVWAGGLVATPFLLVQRRRYDDDTVHRLHWLVRKLHVGIVSPAAFTAVASGILLIFLREVYFVWFSTKLYFVAALASCHVGMGLLITSTFEPKGQLRPAFATALTVTIAVSVLGILFFVLAKPIISLDAIAGEATQPGWLEDSVVAPIVSSLISWTR
jgi:protoporphyrinogen IX oxidase